VLAPEFIVGVDPDALSLHAAQVRARGHALDPRRVTFLQNRPDRELPFANDQFDLVVCVSVLEFLPRTESRYKLVDEIKRVTRPGGHVFLSTPNPLRLRDVHAKRWLGDYRRDEGYPWATAPWTMRAMVADCHRVPIDRWIVARALKRTPLPLRFVPRPLAGALALTRPWQKLLVRKPSQSAAAALTAHR
jgi:SAM-dependent methyltransferase